MTIGHLQTAVLGSALVAALALRRRYGPALCLAAFAATLLVHAAYVAVYKDDAFILFRYARQLLAGNGPNFNAGERVEGYTSPLWVVLSALAGLLGFEIPTAMRVVAVISALALLPVSYVLYDRVLARRAENGRGAIALVVPALVATNGGIAFWAMGAMETVAFALLVTIGVGLSCRAMRDTTAPDPSPLLFALAYLVRPEGALFLGVTQLVRLVAVLRDGHDPRAAIRAPLLAAVSLIALHVAWRWSYYGVPLPNTYYVNAAVNAAGWERGLRYMTRTFDAYLAASRYLDGDGRAFALTRYLPAALAILGLRLADRARTPVYACLAVYLIYVIGVGGDRLGTYRFSVPVFPLFYVLIADGVRTLVDLPRMLSHGRIAAPRTMAVVGFVAVFLVAYGQLYPTEYDVRKRRDINRESFAARRDMADVLCAELAPGESMAVVPAGIIPYYCMAPTLDMLGLSDAHIGRKETADFGAGKPGHEKHDGAYVLSRKPTVIVLGLGTLKRDPRGLSWERLPETLSLAFGSEEIWSDSRLRRDYDFRFTLLPTSRRWFGYFVARER